MAKRWTPDEENIIISNYHSMSSKDLQKLLPGRTADAIQERAKLLGVKKYNRWTEEEELLLKTFYPSIGSDVASMIPRHNKNACTDRANRMGIRKHSSEWTKEEDKIILEYYPSIGRKVSKMLTGRTPRACFDRAKYLGIKIKHKQYNSTWTSEEDKILFKYYPIMGPDVCYKIPKRSRNACSKRARQLGLRKGKY